MLKYIAAFLLVSFSAYAGQNNPGVTVSGAVTTGHLATFTNNWTIQDGGAVPAAGVSSFTGDSALLSNSASTGAVTAALANAAANTVWGNNTGSTAAPGYQKMVTAQLPAFTQAMTASVALLNYGGL